MKIVVIYDSAFGNTEQIARAIADALSSRGDVGLFKAGEIRAEQLRGADLVIVGSPTQGFRPLASIQNFLMSLPADLLKGVDVAAFDTRVSVNDIGAGLRMMVKLGGFAAKRIARSLKKKGGRLIVPEEGFLVKDQKGPLKEGEEERAANWARGIIEALKSAPAIR